MTVQKVTSLPPSMADGCCRHLLRHLENLGFFSSMAVYLYIFTCVCMHGNNRKHEATVTCKFSAFQLNKKKQLEPSDIIPPKGTKKRTVLMLKQALRQPEEILAIASQVGIPTSGLSYYPTAGFISPK